MAAEIADALNSETATTAALCAAVVAFTAWRIAVVRKRYRVLRELRDLFDEQDRTAGRADR